MKSIAGVVILAIVTGFGGCVLWPVNKKNVIGTYQAVLENGTPGLPDGGSEILELKPDGTCTQQISLKDGRFFSAQGTWEWNAEKFYLHNTIMIRSIYDTVVYGEEMNPDLEKSLGKVVFSHPVGRTPGGQVILGSREGVHYEKK